MASGVTVLVRSEQTHWREQGGVARRMWRANTRGDQWGWFAALALATGVALCVLAAADVAARANAPWADTLFWLGLVGLFAPSAWRLCMPAPGETERVALLLLLGLALFAVKLLEYPTNFAFFDEFLHWRTAQDIAATGHLYAPNPLLPVSPLYPGLEIVTNAVSSLTGLSLFASGILVLAVGRVLLVGSLYLFYRRVGGSAYTAGVAALIYMTNPHFLLFDTQFAYESLALPLGALVLWLVARCAGANRTGERIAFAACALLAAGALALTHHLSSYAVIAFLALWAIIAVLRGGGAGSYPRRIALASAIVALVAGGMYLLIVSRDAVVGYLAPHITSALAELVAVATARGLPQHLFHDYAGNTSPAWETYAGVAAVALATIGLLLSLPALRSRRRPSAAALSLAVAALAYPLSQIFRLSPDGMEIADRLPDFLFIALAYPLALAVTRLPRVRAQRSRVRHISPRRSPWRSPWRSPQRYRATPATSRLPRAKAPLLAGAALILFIGGVCIGDGPAWMHLPGPPLVEADMRSIDARTIALATWMADQLGAGHVVATDRDTRLALATYGGQNPVAELASGIDTSTLFTAPALDAATLALLRSAQVEYIVVDERLSEALPAVGLYFEQNEPGAYAHTTPLSRAALEKFDGAPGVTRIFDDGEYRIYDTRALLTRP